MSRHVVYLQDRSIYAYVCVCVCMYVCMLFGSLRRYVKTYRCGHKIEVHMRMYVCMLFEGKSRHVGASIIRQSYMSILCAYTIINAYIQ
jgi:hypothetical protein